jgi:V8-like Glu-specific endopeptidase
MITQVSGLNSGGAVKDPRRKAQRIQFRNTTKIPYQGISVDEYERQKKDALWTSVYVVVSSLLLTSAYLFFSGIKDFKK